MLSTTLCTQACYVNYVAAHSLELLKNYCSLLFFLQDDYVRTWDENQGSNDSKSHSLTISSLSHCVLWNM